MLIYDWLSLTNHSWSTSYFKELLGLDINDWESGNGFKGYRQRDYREGISIHHGGGIAQNMGSWLEMSGKGCRAFESLGHGDWERVFETVRTGDNNVTRLDVAFDDTEGILDIEKLCRETIDGNYVSKFDNWSVLVGSGGSTITHGSKSSAVFVRIYDKAKEQGLAEGEHWIRVELQLRGDRASEFIKSELELGIKFSGVMNNYVRYVTPNLEDTRRARWPTADYWQAFLETSEKIKLYTPLGMEYDIMMLEDYVIKQAGNSIDTLIRIIGLDNFMKKIRQRGTTLNPKQQNLLKEYIREKELSKTGIL